MKIYSSFILLFFPLCTHLSAQKLSVTVAGNPTSSNTYVINTSTPAIKTTWNQGSAAYLYELNTYLNQTSIYYNEYPSYSSSFTKNTDPLPEGGPYTVYAEATARTVDGYDNSIISDSVLFYVDLQFPSVQINKVNDSTTIVASDAVGLQRVELWVDSGAGPVRQADLYSASTVETSLKQWTGKPNISVCSNTAQITVYAVDWLNRRVSALASVSTPDTAAPAVTPSVITTLGVPEVSLSATITDVSPIGSVLFKVDGVIVASFGAQGPYQKSLTFSDGPHTFAVTASDCRGNIATTLPSSFNIKRSFSDAISGPSINIASGASASIDLARIRIGDFNGDGRADFLQILGWGSSAASSVFLSSGDGNYYSVSGPSFSVASTLPMVDLGRVLTGDFNGDGRTDLLRINGWGSSEPMSIFLASSDGTFSAAKNGPTTSVGNTEAAAYVDCARVKIGDFNGDGKADIAVIQGWGTASPSLIYLSKGDGTFFPAVNGPSFSVANNLDGALVDLRRVRVADFNGDRAADFLRINGWGTSSAMDIYLATGNGAFQASQPGPSMSVAASIQGANVDLNRVKIGDFNGDGKADIAVIDGWGTEAPARIFLATGSGAFSAAYSGPPFSIAGNFDGAQLDLNRIRIGDFNGDGADDLLRINGSPYASIYLSSKAGTFPYWLKGPAITGHPDRVFLGDFSGGGTKDILVINGEGSSLPVTTYLSRLP